MGDEVVDAEAIRRAFRRLDPDKRSLLVLHYVESRPLGEIAGVLGIPTGTVKWRLSRAREALERALEAER
jgi:RNA polymerase sigma-70 factor (ECF subfamily)